MSAGVFYSPAQRAQSVAAYRQIFRQAAVARNGRGAVWAAWLLAGLALLCVVAIPFGLERRLATGFCVGLLGMLAYMWWGLFLVSAATQNQPVLNLVPGLHRRLVRAVIVSGAVIVVVLAAILASAFGHFMLALVGFGWLLTTALLGQRFVAMYFFLPFFAPTMGRLGDWADKHAAAWMAGLPGVSLETIVVVFGMLALLPIAPFALRTVLPQGGDAAWRMYGRVSRREARLKTGEWEKVSLDTRWSRWWEVGYLAALRRASTRAAPQRRLPMDIVMAGLGPRLHWAKGTLFSVTALVAMLVVRVTPLAAFFDGEAAVLWVQALLSAAVLIHVFVVAFSLGATATEQGILLLAPGTVAPAQLNRQLASALLAGFARIWAAMLVCACAIDWLYGVPGGDWTRTPALATLLLPLAVFLLRDYASLRTVQADGPLLLAVAGLAGLLLLFRIARDWIDPLPWSVLALICVALTVLLLALQWRRMLAAPPAFPAGRRA